MDERRMGHRFGILDARAKVRIGNARLRLALAGRTFASRAGCAGTLVFFRRSDRRVYTGSANAGL